MNRFLQKTSRLSFFSLALLLVCFLMAWDTSNAIAADELRKDECVILLHALGRSSWSMQEMEDQLIRAGYTTVNLDYSFIQSIEQIAEEQVAQAVAKCRAYGNAQKIHFVTHSLGGIVVRQYLQDNTLPSGSRLVMLAPPNRGSELADRLNSSSVTALLPVPSLKKLGTDSDSAAKTLQPVGVDIGIIAGSCSLNPFFSKMIPGPDDGLVAVERTKLDEMDDFLIVASDHTFMMWNKEAIRQTIHFFKHGRFDHSPEISERAP